MAQTGSYSVQNGKGRVYMDFFRLREVPFSLSPDPDFFFFSQTHQQVIDKILYGIYSRMGFILLVGEVGTGKTTICRAILDNLKNSAETVYIINPSLSGTELISSILDDLNISHSPDASKKVLTGALNRFLLAMEEQRPVVIIIDDAQTMPVEALEDLRLLSNLETDKNKLLQIVLVGQPELKALISRPALRQLHQRVGITCLLEYLTAEEVGHYILRRLFVAGDPGRILFAPESVRLIFRASDGIPRLINKICDYALTAGYVDDSFTIGPVQVKRALAELGEGDPQRTLDDTPFISLFKRLRWVLPGVAVLFGAALFFDAMHNEPREGKMEAGPAIITPAPADTPEQTGRVPDDPFPPQAASSPKPYALQLGSYKTPAQVDRAISIYSAGGIEANWQLIDSGPGKVWYRLYAGRFETRESAQAYLETHAIGDAVVLFVPWTVDMGIMPSEKEAALLGEQLRRHRLGCETVQLPDGTSRVFSGVFSAERGALEASEALTKLVPAARAVPR